MVVQALLVYMRRRFGDEASVAVMHSRPTRSREKFSDYYAGTLTNMEKIRIYLRKEELRALRNSAKWSGNRVADLIRDAIGKMVLESPAAGLVAIWDGEPKRSSVEHDEQ